MTTRIKGLIFHWSDSGPSTTVDQIRQWHLKRGWRDIGYHRVIEHPQVNPHATQWGQLVKSGRTLNTDLYMESVEVGAHTLGYNTGYVGVCVVSGPGHPIHDMQRTAVINIAHLFMARFQFDRQCIWGHRDKNATQCPGDEIYTIVKALRSGEL